MNECKDNTSSVRIYNYAHAAEILLPQLPVHVYPAAIHESGPSQVTNFDLSDAQGIPFLATTPNLLAAFVRVLSGDSLSTQVNATSQAFYVIRGEGCTTSEHGEVQWSEGDLFVVPWCEQPLVHHCATSSGTAAALYWVHDQPLLTYLGVRPDRKRFELTVFRKERMLSEVQQIAESPEAHAHNRLGILLGNVTTENSIKTLTHTLWSLLNTLPPKHAQRPHKHNSVALDLCVSAPAGDDVYTLMGPELDDHGWVKNPVKCVWRTGAVFTTPPGWWHSHHNDSDVAAWVLPMQDAGLLTYQRILDIKFSSEK